MHRSATTPSAWWVIGSTGSKPRWRKAMDDLEQTAIERLKAASEMSLMAYQQPLVICISGGKDSCVATDWR